MDVVDLIFTNGPNQWSMFSEIEKNSNLEVGFLKDEQKGFAQLKRFGQDCSSCCS